MMVLAIPVVAIIIERNVVDRNLCKWANSTPSHASGSPDFALRLLSEVVPFPRMDIPNL